MPIWALQMLEVATQLLEVDKMITTTVASLLSDVLSHFFMIVAIKKTISLLSNNGVCMHLHTSIDKYMQLLSNF